MRIILRRWPTYGLRSAAWLMMSLAGAAVRAEPGGPSTNEVSVTKTLREAAADPVVAGKGREFLWAVGLWCAVLVMGVALIAMVILWGRRLRRAGRRQRLHPTDLDPLWYLKPKKTPPIPPVDRPIGSGPDSSVSPT